MGHGAFLAQLRRDGNEKKTKTGPSTPSIGRTGRREQDVPGRELWKTRVHLLSTSETKSNGTVCAEEEVENFG